MSSSEEFGILQTAARVLTFRCKREELLALHDGHLNLGLVLTWLVGVGRYWDNSKVGLFQHSGLGSVIYVFLLSLFLWLLLMPLRPSAWSYRRLLTFITLTAPPAVLYAIPVEMICGIETANLINLDFLGIVASWRLALLIWYLCQVTQLHPARIAIGVALPIILLITTLTVLNLDKVVFDMMGGFREHSAFDVSYGVLMAVTLYSWKLFLPLLVTYLFFVWQAWKSADRAT